MITPSTIQYISHQHIDKTKWDSCIDNDIDGRIYASSYYLDTMAGNWDALVAGDYETVMPLPWRKKKGISYIFQPAFIAQLGVFGKNADQLTPGFLHAIPSKFKLVDLSIKQIPVEPGQRMIVRERMNYILHLNKSYDELRSAYRDNIKRNIKKHLQLGCYLKKNIDLNEIIQLASEQEKGNTKKEDFQNFAQLYHRLQQKGKAVNYGIYSKSNQLLSSAAYFFSHNRAYYILVGNHPNGRTLGASHALIDAFIKDHAGKNLILDFEGSDIRNLAFFYSSFGALEERYASIRWNRLPWWLKWLKK